MLELLFVCQQALVCDRTTIWAAGVTSPVFKTLFKMLQYTFTPEQSINLVQNRVRSIIQPRSKVNSGRPGRLDVFLTISFHLSNRKLISTAYIRKTLITQWNLIPGNKYSDEIFPYRHQICYHRIKILHEISPKFKLEHILPEPI